MKSQTVKTVFQIQKLRKTLLDPLMKTGFELPAILKSRIKQHQSKDELDSVSFSLHAVLLLLNFPNNIFKAD